MLEYELESVGTGVTEASGFFAVLSVLRSIKI